MSRDWRVPVLDCLLPQSRCGLALGKSLRSDKWLASSSLQKCIRHGHVELALRAAATFGELDPAGLWRRLISIACEGVRPLVDAVLAGLDRLNEIRREIWCGLRADPQYPSSAWLV
jgi:hypothetical protein